MKAAIHALAGVSGFVCVLSFLTLTAVYLVSADPELTATIKRGSLFGMAVLIPALVGAGASGMSLLGERKAPLGLTKQQRGPMAFMTSLFVLLPCAIFLSYRASAELIDAWFYGVQVIETGAQLFAATMIGLNIRDGLILRGRIGRGKAGRPSIELRDGGPLVVLGKPELKAGDGSALQSKAVMALCRCGESKNKPFCDGSHALVGFDSNPSDDRTKDEVLTYEGSEAAIHYNRLLCSHAAECGRRQKAAFDSSRSPWIEPDNASRKGLLEVVQACPSGALRIALPEAEGPQQLLPEGSSVTVEENGPYRILRVPLESPRLATGASPDKYVLCRCGASKNKPYCDGSHVDIGWKA